MSPDKGGFVVLPGPLLFAVIVEAAVRGVFIIGNLTAQIRSKKGVKQKRQTAQRGYS